MSSKTVSWWTWKNLLLLCLLQSTFFSNFTTLPVVRALTLCRTKGFSISHLGRFQRLCLPTPAAPPSSRPCGSVGRWLRTPLTHGLASRTSVFSSVKRSLHGVSACPWAIWPCQCHYTLDTSLIIALLACAGYSGSLCGLPIKRGSWCTEHYSQLTRSHHFTLQASAS